MGNAYTFCGIFLYYLHAGTILHASDGFRFENMWVPLGVGVAGFLSGMALANARPVVLMAHPFVLMLKPAVAMSARPDPMAALFSLAETLLFLAAGLWMAKYRRCE